MITMIANHSVYTTTNLIRVFPQNECRFRVIIDNPTHHLKNKRGERMIDIVVEPVGLQNHDWIFLL